MLHIMGHKIKDQSLKSLKRNGFDKSFVFEELF